MAAAEKTTRKMMVEVEEEVLSLALNKEEAYAVFLLCFNAGGDEKKSLRRSSDKVREAIGEIYPEFTRYSSDPVEYGSRFAQGVTEVPSGKR